MGRPDISSTPRQAGSAAEFALPELTSQQKAELSVASQMVLVLLDPDNKLLLDTLYEGSSFTPTIGYAVGIEPADTPEESRKNFEPVLKGLQSLRKERAISFERTDMIETVDVGDNGDTKERAISTSVIQVILNPENARAFIDEELETQN